MTLTGFEKAREVAEIVLQFGIVGFLILMQALIIWAIATKKIDLELLISEKSGGASLSRFQLLMFTFAIVGLYIAIGFSTDPLSFPKLNGDTLGLLGISGLTYGGSKFIQMNGKNAGEAGESEPSGRFVR